MKAKALEYPELPEFLIISAAERAAAWERFKPAIVIKEYKEEWERKAEERRAHEKERKRQKNAAAFERMLAKHPGEVYNRKTKSWVPDPRFTATVTEQETEPCETILTVES